MKHRIHLSWRTLVLSMLGAAGTLSALVPAAAQSGLNYPSFVFNAVWSSGRTSGAGLHVMNADETGKQVIIRGGETVSDAGVTGTIEQLSSYGGPCLSPTGNKVTFYATIRQPGGSLVRCVATVNSLPASSGGLGFKVLAKMRNPLTGVADGSERDGTKPNWSPQSVLGQGERILFTDYSEVVASDPIYGDTSRDQVLYVANSDGTACYPLMEESLDGPYYELGHASWSPDATRVVASGIYWENYHTSTLTTFNITFNEATQKLVATHGMNLAPQGSPIWSLYCKEPAWANTSDNVVVAAGGDLWIVDPSVMVQAYDALGAPLPWLTPLATNLTNTPNLQEASPSWSPDDRKIYFTDGSYTTIKVLDVATGRKSALKTKAYVANRRRR